MNVHPKSAAAKPWPTPGERPQTPVDPIILQIVEGTLNSIEAEIEYAIERTARSPMIREAHDYRVGLFDRYCRKLTGRSYSAMPNAVVRDFPPATMAPVLPALMMPSTLPRASRSQQRLMELSGLRRRPDTGLSSMPMTWVQ